MDDTITKVPVGDPIEVSVPIAHTTDTTAQEEFNIVPKPLPAVTVSIFERIGLFVDNVLASIGIDITMARVMLLLYPIRTNIQNIFQIYKRNQIMTLQQFELWVTPLGGVLVSIFALFHILPGVTADNISQVLTSIWSAVAGLQSVWLTIKHLINAQHIAATPGSPTNAAAQVIQGTQQAK